MKTLKQHTIFYDQVCPMCNLYTGAFVKTGMLDKEGRKAYQQMPEECALKIDRRRAVDEIALLDHSTGRVHYGVDSLFVILQHSFPFLKPLFGFQPFAWLMSKLYKFISYNRRVIMPSREKIDDPAYSPSFNKKYRLLYLAFAWFITALVLFNYSRLLVGLIPASNFYREFLVCGGQIIWQLIVISLLHKNKSWDYLGTMMTISFGGAVLLLPALFIGRSVSHYPYVFGGYFMFVVLLMLLEHIRRTKILGISNWLSVSWVVYRIILLLIII